MARVAQGPARCQGQGRRPSTAMTRSASTCRPDGPSGVRRNVSHAQVSGPGTPWWHGAVIYQLYVRSWRDSNDDGYGDLRGITERLDHPPWRGRDAVWLSPTMPPPDEDWGYDVSDYWGVRPELGTL